MKKTFAFVLVFCVLSATTLMAGGRGCPGGGCRPCPGPWRPAPCRPCHPYRWRGGCYYDRGGWGTTRDLVNAAAITSMVASGVSIISDLTRPTTTVVAASPTYTTPVYTTPVYTTPVYTTPVYTTPVYTAPVVVSQTPVVANPTPVVVVPAQGTTVANPVYVAPQPVYYAPAPIVVR